jgi:glucose-1-phosphate thymidylyltransferase
VTCTHDSLVEASSYIQTIEKRQGQRIAVPEEIAFVNGWIGREDLVTLGSEMQKNGYGQYLLRLAKDGKPPPKAAVVGLA